MSQASSGNRKVGSYAQSKWLVDSDVLEVRAAALYDLETEVEVIQERLYELLTSFAAHWVVRGVVTGLVTAEIADLFYVKLQADVKAFHLEPISFEIQEPDWLSGEYQEIVSQGLESCAGIYTNFQLLPVRLSLILNVKKCEGSIMDWITGKGVAGPGFHIYCYYEEANEIELARPLYYSGVSTTKHAWAQDCYRDVFYDYGYEDDDETPYYNPKYGY